MNKPLFPAIRARLEQATPGPWERCEFLRSGIHEKGKCSGAYPISCTHNETTDLIANTPSDLSKLLACLDEAVEALEFFADDLSYNCIEHGKPVHFGCLDNTPVYALGKEKARQTLARLSAESGAE